MNGELGIIILWIVMGFFVFVTLVCGLLFLIFWRRRKLTFLNFLSNSGQWERLSLMPKKVDKEIEYDGVMYKYDIKLCTRDRINRPIAHYYKGNPEQQLFKYENLNKTVVINTNEITVKDFMTLMLSKVIRDIFQDDEVMNMLLMILIAVVLGTIIIVICVFVKRTPPVHLVPDNETINLIAVGVKQAISGVK